MQDSRRLTNRKKDKKPLYLLVLFIFIFGVFIYLLTRPSLQSTAIEKLQVCNNTNDVKTLYERYKFELLETDENGLKVVSSEFQNAVRQKLSSFNLNNEELVKCLDWIPPSKKNINVIVIPDLSRRIIDTINNPNQINNDKFVLSTIWKQFIEYSKLKQDSKDRLMVDVTDIDQAKGQFSIIANKLLFDLSEHKGKSNRLYFTGEKNNQFYNAISELYESAKQKPLGADYLFYFRRHLVNHIKKPTLYDKYINKVIIITDGYLESENRDSDTKITPQLYNSLKTGNTIELITVLGLSIPKVNIDLSNTDILVCEVNERKIGRTKDFEILQAYWYDWLSRMKANKISFIQREQANDLTKQRIEDFFKN
jgi:hypothetical protein